MFFFTISYSLKPILAAFHPKFASDRQEKIHTKHFFSVLGYQFWLWPQVFPVLSRFKYIDIYKIRIWKVTKLLARHVGKVIQKLWCYDYVINKNSTWNSELITGLKSGYITRDRIPECSTLMVLQTLIVCLSVCLFLCPLFQLESH